MSAAIALLELLLLLRIETTGNTECPTAASVTAELAPMADAKDRPGARAVITENGDHLRVDLRNMDGAVLATRRLHASGTCAARASALAVVIATWLRAEASEDPSAHLTERGGPVAAPAVPTAPTGDSPLAEPTAPSPAPWSWRLLVDIGALAFHAENRVAPGVEVGARIAGPPSIGLRAEFHTTESRMVPLSNPVGASVRWRRSAIALGPSWIGRRGRYDLQVDLAIVVARVDASGVGLTTEDRSIGIALGPRGCAYAGLVFGRTVASIGVGALYWPGRQEVVVSRTVERDFPHMELQLGLRLAVGFPGHY